MLTEKETITSFKRHRRLRSSQAIRETLRENRLFPSDIVAPLFVTENSSSAGPITALPGINRYTEDSLLSHIEQICNLGITKIALFPEIDPLKKSADGREAYNEHSLVHTLIKTIKSNFPELLIFADVALDPYTSHGHDGIFHNSQIHNDLTVEALTYQALSLATAGADFIAPSDMMDGRIAAIRKTLDTNNFQNTGILSYTAKYASALYGPFRSAINTSLTFGDKKTYQMDPANKQEAIREAISDIEEGADLLMVKPALSYLDIIHTLKEKTNTPVGAYHVSGEYAMVMAAHNAGYLDGPAVLKEHLLSIKRAGATFIYTYAYSLI